MGFFCGENILFNCQLNLLNQLTVETNKFLAIRKTGGPSSDPASAAYKTAGFFVPCAGLLSQAVFYSTLFPPRLKVFIYRIFR
jgi:hypothetical protein